MYVPPAVWPDILPIVEKLPVPVVFDHMGGMMAGTPIDDPVFRRILALLESGRCWTKLTGYRPSLAGPPYSDVMPLARQFIDRVPDRCVWGSDWPHTNIEGYMPDDGDLLDQLGVGARCGRAQENTGRHPGEAVPVCFLALCAIAGGADVVRFRVVDVFRALSGEFVEYRLRRADRHANERGAGLAGDVRRQDDVRQSAERRIASQRLALVGVERGAAQCS